MNAWRSFLRNSRLSQEHQSMIQERNLEKMQAEATRQKTSSLPKIEGLIGLSFDKTPKKDLLHKYDSFSAPAFSELLKDDNETLDPDSSKYRRSKWCYDTPGVVHDDQVINILTTEELTNMLPKSTIMPRMYSIYPEQSLLIGGLGRIDLVECDAKMARLVVYASLKLPVSVCYTEHVEEVYNTLLGTKYFCVPSGNAKRLNAWPPLKSTGDFKFTGKGYVTCLGDIVLSSAGWISPVAAHNVNFVLRPFTPDGRGIHLRTIPLLRYTAQFRRRRIHNTPTYFMSHQHKKI